MAVSGAVTLVIFAGWLMVRTHGSEVVAENPTGTRTLAAVNEVGPLESLGDSFTSAWNSLKAGWGTLTESVGEIDVRSGYDELREESSVSTYGN